MVDSRAFRPSVPVSDMWGPPPRSDEPIGPMLGDYKLASEHTPSSIHLRS